MKWNLGVMVLVIILLISFVGAPLTISANELTENNDSHIADPPWPCFGGNAARTGLSPYNTSRVNGALLWRTKLAGSITSSPAIGSDGTIYVGGSFEDKVYAINPDGSIRWSYTTEGSVSSSPAIGEDGTIYVGSYDGYLYAFNSDGTVKWRSYVTHVSSSPVVGADGNIFVGSRNNYLYAIDPEGNIIWRYETGGEIYSSPALSEDGTIYIGSLDGGVYAINYDGTLRWKYTTGDWVWSTPAVGEDGTVYVGSDDCYLYALDRDGTLRWRYNIGGDISSSPAIGEDGTIYVGSEDDNLYAIDFNGTMKWAYKTDNWVNSSPSISADGTIYFGSFDNKLYAVDLDGSLKWRFGTEGRIYSSPAIGSDGTIYFGSNDGFLYAIGEGEGLQLTKDDALYTVLTVFAAAALGVLPLFIKYRKLSGSLHYIKKEEDVSKTILEKITNSADLRIVLLSVIMIAVGIYLKSYTLDEPMTYGFQTMPYRMEGFLLLFFGVFLFVIGSFIRRVKRSHTHLISPPPEGYVAHDKTIDEPIWVTIKHTKDIRVMAFGIFIILFGLFIFIYGPLILFILPFGYYLPWSPDPYLIIGIAVTVYGMFKNKRKSLDDTLPSPDNTYIKKPGMKRCPRCSQEAVVVEEDNSAFCEHCGYSSIDFSSETYEQGPR